MPGDDFIYLDHHATTPCDPRVVEAMLPTFSDVFANAASRQHRAGARARDVVERGRERIASALGCEAADVIFTSGATESNNLALRGVLGECAAGHIVTTAIEHKSVLDTCRRLEQRGCAVTYVRPGADGVVRVDAIRDALRDDTALVSVMFANNEVGTVNPVAEIGALCKSRGVLFHCDAVQALAYLDCDVDALGADLLSISAHKIYGPKGIGALYVRRRRPRVRLAPIIDGGGHERGLRSGTLNVSGIAGMAEACALVAELRESESARVGALRDRMLERLAAAIPELVINGTLAKRLPNNLNVSFPGVSSATLLCSIERVALSSGSACSSASVDGSYVLRAMGREPEIADSSVRIGLGRFTTDDEVDRAVGMLVDALRALAI